jgi:hypothetical protein
MLSFNLYFVDQPYTSHELPLFVSSCTLFPTTCWAMNMCELTLAVTHPPHTHRRRTGGSRGAIQRGVRFDLGGVSQLTLWRQGWTLVRSIFILYFVRLPLCNNYSDYCDIYLYTLCYYMCCLLWRMYEMHRLCPLKPSVTIFEFVILQDRRLIFHKLCFLENPICAPNWCAQWVDMYIVLSRE